MKKIFIFISIFFGIFLFFTENTSNVSAEEKYSIGTDVTYPPFEFANKNNKYIGIDIDLMKAIARKEKFRVDIKPIGFDSAIQSLEAGQINGVIAGTEITSGRKQKLNFSKPYYKTGDIMAVNKNSKIRNFKQLYGKRVAIKTGTAAANYANSIKNKFGFHTVTFDDSNNMYDDVINGNSIACFEDIPVMKYAIKTGTKLKIVTKPQNNGYYGFSVKKGRNKKLLNKFNNGLDKLKKDGQYKKIINKYLNSSNINNIKKQNNKNPKKINENSFFGLIRQNHKAFLSGIEQTMYLTVVGIFFATIFGVIIGFLGTVPHIFFQGFSTVIIYIFRGLPLLVLALFIYNGLPNLTGIKIPAFVAGIITLTLNEGAYTAAFVKGGINSVNKGQMEAARSLGLSFGKAMRYIILPQGIKIMVPSFVNQFIITLKDTSILSIIGILELTQTGKIIIARNLQGFRIWLIIALIYLIIITVLTILSKLINKKINVVT